MKTVCVKFLPILLVLVACDRIPITAPFWKDSPARASLSKSNFEKKKQCVEEGWKAYERAKRDFAGTSAIIKDPHFAYDPVRDTCLCEFETMDYMRTSDGRESKVKSGRLLDVFTNKVIADYFTGQQSGGPTDDLGGNDTHMTQSQYFEKRKQIMGY